jgi:hypothetical protein
MEQFMEQFDRPLEEWTEDTLANIERIPSTRVQELLIQEYRGWQINAPKYKVVDDDILDIVRVR